METVILPHFPEHPLHLGLFTNVRNAQFLRQQLLAGNRDFEYAFLDASCILSRTQVLAACSRAINDLAHDRLKSHNVHSEVVFSLSPNNNIAESFRRFGVSDESKNLLAIKIGSNFEQVKAHLQQHLEGELIAFTDANLADMTDITRIRKIYRIEAPKKGEPTGLNADAEAFILGSMALKGS